MASPPAAFSQARSPPYPGPLQLPKKRSSVAADLAGSNLGSSSKRRKPSMLSAVSASSAHPLRQTSFPPEDAPSAAFSPSRQRSPSVDTMSFVSGSQVSGAAAARRKKKRGRKSKAERAREAAQDAASSVAGGTAASAASGGAAGQAKDDDAEGGRDGEGELVAPESMSSKSAARTKEQAKEEERIRALVKQRMDEQQFHRYEVWHQAKVSMPAVRRVSPLSLLPSALSPRACRAG